MIDLTQEETFEFVSNAIDDEHGTGNMVVTHKLLTRPKKPAVTFLSSLCVTRAQRCETLFLAFSPHVLLSVLYLHIVM